MINVSYKSNITKYFIFTFLSYFYLWMPIWVLFFQDIGLSLNQIGIIDAAGFLLIACAEVPTGVVADKFGKKYSLAVGALLYAIGMFTIVIGGLSIWFYLGFVLWNLANPFLSGATTAMLYDSLTKLDRKKEYQKLIGRSNALAQTSQISASLIGGILASFHFESCFILAGILSLFAAAIALTMKEPIPDDEEQNHKQNYLHILKSSISIIVKKPPLMYILLFSSLMSSFIFLLTYIMFQPYAHEVGYSITAFGVLVFFIRGSSIAGHMLTDKFNIHSTRNIAVLLSIAVSLCMGLMGIIPSKSSILFLLFISFMNGLISPYLSKVANGLIPSKQRATVLSFQGLLWTALIAGLEPLALFIAEKTNIIMAMFINGFILLFLSSLIFLLWFRSKEVDSIEVKSRFKGV